MTTVRFVHCADLHLDTPFRGISRLSPEVAQALNDATFDSFQNIVDLAIEEAVDFVVIAGDVYDSKDRSLTAQVRFRDGLARLAEHCIPSYIACGNHDPLNGWSHTLQWPDMAYTFGPMFDSCQHVRDGEAVATIHGMSFPKTEVKEDLAARFQAPDDGLPSIAVLHCNVGGNTGHEPYAPTTVAELSSKGFTYWALGHVHAHNVLKAIDPAIVYPGCSQSRQPNETGAKGCCVVTLEDNRVAGIEFRATDTVRFFKGDIDVSGCTSIDAIRDRVMGIADAAAAAADGRHLVVRLTLTGRTPLQEELSRGDTISGLAESVRGDLLARETWVWMEKLVCETHATYDVAQLRQQQDFAGDIVRAYSALLESVPDELAALQQELEKDIASSAQGKLAGSVTEEEFRELAEKAMHETLDLVLRED
jgi:exonuclease SbcD